MCLKSSHTDAMTGGIPYRICCLWMERLNIISNFSFTAYCDQLLSVDHILYFSDHLHPWIFCGKKECTRENQMVQFVLLLQSCTYFKGTSLWGDVDFDTFRVWLSSNTSQPIVIVSKEMSKGTTRSWITGGNLSRNAFNAAGIIWRGLSDIGVIQVGRCIDTSTLPCS